MTQPPPPGPVPQHPGVFAPYGAAPVQPPPVPVRRPVQPALPVAWREFHEFYRAPKWRWWRGLLAILLMGAIWFAASMVVIGIQSVIDMALGNEVATPVHGEIKTTPALFLANNITIALFIPACLLAHRVVVGQPAGYLSSVLGRIRWGWLGTCLAICTPIWLVLTAAEIALGRSWEGLAVNPATWVLLVGILLTTPFQAAGEEYFNRALLPKVLGGWVPDREIGLAVGALVSAVIFALMHAAADPWLNVFYFTFGLMASIIAWRTGGLEATIAIHVVNNLTSEWDVPFTDISDMFNRAEGAGDWTIVFPLLAVGLAWGLIELAARRHRIERRSRPAVEPVG